MDHIICIVVTVIAFLLGRVRFQLPTPVATVKVAPIAVPSGEDYTYLLLGRDGELKSSQTRKHQTEAPPTIIKRHGRQVTYYDLECRGGSKYMYRERQ